MADRDVLLIHGTWATGRTWGDFADGLRALGYRPHAPTLRHHARPQDDDVWEQAERVRRVGLQDYVDDLQAEAQGLPTRPIIVGHSLGGLIAQLLAARVRPAGLVLLSPAPAAGMFALYPSMLRLWARYLPRWLGSRPMFPVPLDTWERHLSHAHPAEQARADHRELCAESGRAYRQFALGFLDRSGAGRVDADAVDCPVLVVTGTEDRCVHPGVARQTAARYGARAQLSAIRGSDHRMTSGPHLPEALELFRDWAQRHGLGPSTDDVAG